MNKFNDYKLALLEQAIKEESDKDIRINAAMQYETADLYGWWKKHPEDTIAFEALLLLLDWWGIYFTCGYEAAQQIREKIYQKELAAARQHLNIVE